MAKEREDFKGTGDHLPVVNNDSDGVLPEPEDRVIVAPDPQKVADAAPELARKRAEKNARPPIK